MGTAREDRHAPEVELHSVPLADREELEALVDRYLEELDALRDLPVGPSDARSYEYLPLYWEEPGRHPLFLVSRGERVGFALIREIFDDATIQMSEFYIRPEWRRRGLGRAAVGEIWRRFPGSWELQVHPGNPAAAEFWARCIGEVESGSVTKREVVEADGRRVQYDFVIDPAAR